MLDDPRSIGEALTGTILGQLWKYRVGDYRIICDIQDGKLTILALRVDTGARCIEHHANPSDLIAVLAAM